MSRETFRIIRSREVPETMLLEPISISGLAISAQIRIQPSSLETSAFLSWEERDNRTRPPLNINRAWKTTWRRKAQIKFPSTLSGHLIQLDPSLSATAAWEARNTRMVQGIHLRGITVRAWDCWLHDVVQLCPWTRCVEMAHLLQLDQNTSLHTQQSHITLQHNL